MKLTWLLALLLVGACAAQSDGDDGNGGNGGNDPGSGDDGGDDDGGMEDDLCEDDGVCTRDSEFTSIISFSWGAIEERSNTGPHRRRRSADYGYNSMPYNVPNSYGPGYYSEYRGYEQGSYRYPVKKEHRSFHYTVPRPSYHKSFREGKWHLDNKHVVKNYYKKGTYEVAKQFFVALPFVRIIPVKTTTSIDYVTELRTYSGYKAKLCEHCYHGHPQIELRSLSSPSRNVIRRFNFLPETKRTRTEYGHARVVQTGNAHVSYDQGNVYNGQYLNSAQVPF